jgi:spore germination cell wall hydrolase CwlJ-like protein
MPNQQIFGKPGLIGSGQVSGGIDPITIETIAREAANQPLEAQAMVAKVIKTRSFERGLLPEQVVKQPLQFSCWNPGVKQKPRTPAEIANAQKAWDLSATIEAEPNLYHDTTVHPKWADSPKVKFIKRVGDLMFYREG